MQKVLEANPIAQQTFRIVTGKVIKVTLVAKDIEAYCNDEFSAEIVSKALNNGRVTPSVISISLTEATEADLVAAKSARPDQAHNADALIKFLKQAAEPPPPIRVEITNASDLQRQRVTRATRRERKAHRSNSAQDLSGLLGLSIFGFGVATGLFIAASIVRRERLRGSRSSK